MTLKTALAQGTKLLEEGGVEAPKLTAEVLLAHALKKERVYLIAHANEELSELGWIHFGRYLHQRLQRKPTQYITRQQEFYGRTFYVDERVLIPRPETELLVESVLPQITQNSVVLDVGTGSGCIAISIALETRAFVVSSETSAAALAVAAANAGRLGAKVHFILADQALAIKSGSLDVLVSNPPYIPEHYSPKLPPEILNFEPHSALFSGADGLDSIRALVQDSSRVLKPGALLAFEFGFGQSAAVRQLLPSASISTDLAGIDRICHNRV
ncbi:MAG: peptide chain release factor N(5)-glutamine methyltransferase [Acidobacteria bacterium]|nr:peptide chain release factor N(5)-glutamine methyltransferase [Acidobacteriota bacterium]